LIVDLLHHPSMAIWGPTTAHWRGLVLPFGVNWDGSPSENMLLFVRVKESGRLIRHNLSALVSYTMDLCEW
jgi:hypothetical protein